MLPSHISVMLEFDASWSFTEMKKLSEHLKHYLKDIPFSRQVYRGFTYSKYYIEKVRRRAQYKTISKKEFINDLKNAIETNTGYAAGKIGASQQHWMYYEVLLAKEKNSNKIKQFEERLIFHGLKQVGIFPPEPSFYLQYNNNFYMDHIRNLDCLGVFYYPEEVEIIQYYQLSNKLTYFMNQEPDRSSPSNEDNCYLQYFRGKKLLLVCPFGELLKERATKEIFEKVWSKTGKKWFYPEKVDALEFPYGFSSETHKKYPTAIDLYKDIVSEIDKKDFDIALISAAGLAIPIASYIKSIGKVGIDLGGHQQILFGVIGKRWRENKDFQTKYFNEYWIDMPDAYKPKEIGVCDQGAYW